jgi:hypothetical protein
MGELADEVVRAATALGLEIEKLDDAEAQTIRTKVEQLYSPIARSRPLWKTAEFSAAVHDRQAWSWIGEFLDRRPSVLFFDPDEDPALFRIQSGAALNALLGETFGFELYVADDRASFLLCFNHHDMLLGAGAAAPWLKSRGAMKR